MDSNELYAEAMTDLQSVSDPLFDLATQQVRKLGAFLPFAATLDSEGTVGMHSAAPEHEMTNAAEVLPLLHEGLRAAIAPSTLAVAVCEWVKITPEGGNQTDAVKVLVEHSNGLVVALYLPMRKRLLGKWQSGEMLVMPAEPEVGLGQPPN